VSAGLLLRDDLHSRYDRLEWSLYCDDVSPFRFEQRSGHFTDRFPMSRTVCTTSTSLPLGKAKQISNITAKKLDPKDPLKFRLPNGDSRDLPNPKLLEWHYRQCVQARFRGFAYDMAVNAQGGAIIDF
jgi:hypothetical protein